MATSSLAAPPFWESGSSFRIAIKGYANTGTANNAPVFDSAAVSRSVAENTAAGQNVGAAVTATDADTGDTLTYTLGGADAASFDIVSTSGQIQTKTGVTYDHEAKASYAVTVTASDSTDTADATVTISVTDVDEPPAAPAAPTVTATTGSTTSLDVTWTAPTNTGKPAIDNYDLQYRQGNSGNFTAGPQDQTGLTASIGSLTAGTSYQVQVRAHNDEGDGDWSASGTGSTSSQTNNAPVFNPTAVSRSVAENTAAGQNVGAAVTATDADTGDTLTYTLGGADAASFDIVSTSGQIQTKTGVTYDHEAKASYAVTVTASDSTDTADAAVTISVTDVDEPPAAPAAPTVTATTGSTTSLDVTWTAPTNTGKPAIDNYDLQYRQGNSGNFTAGPQDQTGLTASIGSLTAGTSYQVQVRAHNAEGDGDWSTSGTGSTSSQTNNAPVFDSAAVSRSVAENTAAGENVGAAVTATDADTGDTLTYTLGGTDAVSFDIVSTSGQVQTKTGVTYDHEAKASYAVTVTASDGTATADATVTISVTDVDEPPTAPAAPGVAGISGSTTSLTVSWTAPTNTGKPAITSYDVQYRQGTSGAFTNGPQDATGTSANITGLMASTLYQVQVRATNDEGDSAWSASGSGTTGTTATAPVAPAAPTVAAVTGSSTSLAVSWIAPADGGSAITTYDVQFRPGTSGDFEIWFERVTGTSFTLPDLDANTLYEVQVRATNAIGDSGWSASGSGTTNADTFPPALVSAVVYLNGAVIELGLSENLQVSNLPPASAFTVTVGGSAVSVTAVGIVTPIVVTRSCSRFRLLSAWTKSSSWPTPTPRPATTPAPSRTPSATTPPPSPPAPAASPPSATSPPSRPPRPRRPPRPPSRASPAAAPA